MFNGILESNLALKLVCFGMDGVTTFQGSKIGVIMQLKEKHVPFLLGVYYVMHRINLIVYTLLWLSLVAKIEAILQYVYNYYA